MRWSLTDEQLIARTRTLHRWRRTLGVVQLLVGVVFTAGILYGLSLLRSRSLELSYIDKANSPTTQQIAESVDQARFNVGFSLGLAMGGWLAGGGLLVAAGFIWLFVRNRKDELLLLYWDDRDKTS